MTRPLPAAGRGTWGGSKTGSAADRRAGSSRRCRFRRPIRLRDEPREDGLRGRNPPSPEPPATKNASTLPRGSADVVADQASASSRALASAWRLANWRNSRKLITTVITQNVNRNQKICE